MQLNRDGGEPLFAQIAARLRYEIITGTRVAGDRLPSLRDAAEDWGVNLHTVRRAYGELETAGIVSTGQGGTLIRSLGGGETPDATHAVSSFVAEMQERFGIGRTELAAMIARSAEHLTSDRVACCVVECSRALSRGLAAQVEARFDVRARPIDFLNEELPRAGAVIVTFFHADEIRGRITADVDLQCVRIAPSEDLFRALRADAARGKVRHLLLMDRLPGSAHELAVDFQSRVPDVSVEVRILSDPLLAFPAQAEQQVIIATPQTWDRLTPELRMRADVRELTYDADEADLDRVAQALGWKKGATV